MEPGHRGAGRRPCAPIGQDKTVFVHRLVAADTIEEKVVALQARKRDLFDRFVDDGEVLGGGLSEDEVRGLFA